MHGVAGEKGVGFKSVFKITDKPHIVSGPWRFCFDAQPEAGKRLGYVVPLPISEAIASSIRGSEPSLTHIYLPFKSKDARTRIERVIANFDMRSLLFVSICVQTVLPGQALVMVCIQWSRFAKNCVDFSAETVDRVNRNGKLSFQCCQAQTPILSVYTRRCRAQPW